MICRPARIIWAKIWAEPAVPSSRQCALTTAPTTAQRVFPWATVYLWRDSEMKMMEITAAAAAVAAAA